MTRMGKARKTKAAKPPANGDRPVHSFDMDAVRSVILGMNVKVRAR